MLHIIRKKKKYIFESRSILFRKEILCYVDRREILQRIKTRPEPQNYGISLWDRELRIPWVIPPSTLPPPPSLPQPPSPPITYLAQGLLRCAYNTNILLEKHNTERIICPTSSKSSRTCIL
jgi:hypothetical protein